MKSMSRKDLTERKKELELELMKERAMSEVAGSVKNPGRIRHVRHTIARINTLLNKKGGE